MSGRYPPIGDYGLLGDCHSVALVSTQGSIDWCCMPRMDADSVFARILDWDRGGFCSIRPRDSFTTTRRYLDRSLVLETTFHTSTGTARILDCFTMRAGGRRAPRRQLLRVAECTDGRVRLAVDVSPRFEYGSVRPWVRRHGERAHTAIGADAGLFISGDFALRESGRHDLHASAELAAGERARLSLEFVNPEDADHAGSQGPRAADLDARLEETLRWWRDWWSKATFEGPDAYGVLHSAAVLKAMILAPTGAMAAAATTSLPEAPEAGRNWDYRYGWIRDSIFAARSLAELGHDAEADGFRRFIERSAAGSAEELQILYGLDGRRRLAEFTVPELEGYRGWGPVRVGNAASSQFQLDVYGELVWLAVLWTGLGHAPDADYWRFLVEIVDEVVKRWQEPDRGIWEVRGPPDHFVHSKAMCWVALDGGLKIAEECELAAPTTAWRAARDGIRHEIETRGVDAKRGNFVRMLGGTELDASLLLLPIFGYTDYTDDRMVRTVDAIRAELMVDDALVYRYRAEDGLGGDEGVFLPCSFWLVECLARQGRRDEAQRIFDSVRALANDLGLFAEEYDPKAGEMLGNYPQGLTHLSYISAAVALAGMRPVARG